MQFILKLPGLVGSPYSSFYFDAAMRGIISVNCFLRHIGYSSNAANGFLESLRYNPGRDWNVHARALGNVVYVMTSQTSSQETVAEMEEVVIEALQKDDGMPMHFQNV